MHCWIDDNLEKNLNLETIADFLIVDANISQTQ